ncbi:sensor histidine kinase [Draconibacterium sediminis]|uniref:sensor histidine kinase n=1 Tax=Draconibacterium sediminis TaxID=1544798 RepID=UPI0026EFA04F|nr:histidine kinase [Draconibacterium sediminis]
MKQLLLILLIVTSFCSSFAQQEDPLEFMTWNVIRERLFNGENSKAYRFEDDIRFQLKGDATHEDSVIFKGVIDELKSLIETVEVKLVRENGNFIFTILSPEEGTGRSTRFITTKNFIHDVEICINSRQIENINEKENFFRNNAFFYLTKTYEPRFGKTGYFGLFDNSTPDQLGSIKQIDRKLIQKLYSKDFYKQLRINTSNKLSFLYYLFLRFESWIKILTFFVTLVFTILGFIFLLSLKPTTSSISFLPYVKRGSMIVAAISVIYCIYKLPDLFPFIPIMNVYFYLLGKILGTFVYGMICLSFVYLFNRLFVNRIDNFSLKQFFVFITTILSVVICYYSLSKAFVILASHKDSLWVSYLSGATLLKPSTFFDIIIIASLRVLYNFIQFRIKSMVNQKDVEIAKMKELKNQAELHALHSRINPHFLYNSLNSIASLAHTDADKTENMATGLSDLFRYSINKENKTFVSVAQELEMVKKYLEIEKTRFGNRLTYEINAGESTLEKQIPKFLIQPLVENAIKHGLSKMKGNGKIRVEIKQEGKDLLLSIFDNGPDFPDETVSGYGLQNLHDKLDIIYGNQALINWENGAHKNFTIMLKNQFEL